MARLEVDDELLEKFKRSIGDDVDNTDLDDHYIEHLQTALFDLSTDDISTKQLKSELGQAVTVLYAEALMNKTDIATNQTISLLRNKLAIISKGDKYAEQ